MPHRPLDQPPDFLTRRLKNMNNKKITATIFHNLANPAKSTLKPVKNNPYSFPGIHPATPQKSVIQPVKKKTTQKPRPKNKRRRRNLHPPPCPAHPTPPAHPRPPPL